MTPIRSPSWVALTGQWWWNKEMFNCQLASLQAVWDGVKVISTTEGSPKRMISLDPGSRNFNRD